MQRGVTKSEVVLFLVLLLGVGIASVALVYGLIAELFMMFVGGVIVVSMVLLTLLLVVILPLVWFTYN